MRRLRMGWMGLCAVLAGCLLPGPNDPPQPTSSPSPHPAPSGSDFFPPPVAPDMSNVAYAARMRPNSPCVGDTVHVSGLHFNGARRVTVWLKGDTPEQATIVNTYPIDKVPYAVKVGDVAVQPDGSFQADFTLKSVMEPVSTGGRLLVEPGSNLTVVLVDDGSNGSRGLGFTVGATCSASPVPVAASLHLEPAYPCYGEQVTAVGQGFTGPTQTLEFKLIQTRFYDGPTQTVEAPVAPDGTLRYTFRLDDLSNLQDKPRGIHYFLYAFDAADNRKITVPVPICDPELQQALEAPSIPLGLGMQGTISSAPQVFPSAMPPDESESFVIRSQAELEAFGARHGMKAEAIALLPKLDYAKEMGLMTLSGPSYGTSIPEITAVERLADKDIVHAVLWIYEGPLLTFSVVFHFVPVPKSERPVEFAPLAYGYYDQRALLAPALADRKYPQFHSDWNSPPRVDSR